MDVNTKIFLKNEFMEYYKHNIVKEPTQIEKREFGVGNMDNKILFRNKVFKTNRELNNYLQREGPYFISYSSAYYKFPDQRVGYESADLIFDIDVHMNTLSIEKLEVAKYETLKLINLLNSLSITDSEISINFSGNRGYHVHVNNKDLSELGKSERHQIVDYIKAEGLNLSYESTWSNKIKSNLIQQLTNNKIEDYLKIGFDKKTSDRIFNKRFHIISRLIDGCFYVNKFQDEIQKLINKTCLNLISNIDEAVTTDLSRLIRLPNTLHGTTGLIAKTIPLTKLSEFNPTCECIAFSEEPLKVNCNGSLSFDLCNSFTVTGTVEVPKYAGIYIMLNNKGELK